MVRPFLLNRSFFFLFSFFFFLFFFSAFLTVSYLFSNPSSFVLVCFLVFCTFCFSFFVCFRRGLFIFERSGEKKEEKVIEGGDRGGG